MTGPAPSPSIAPQDCDSTPQEQTPFEGFWLGGFEGADHVNGYGQPLEPNQRNGHTARLAADYAAAQSIGLHGVRESIGWRLLDAAGPQGLRSLRLQAQQAAAHGLQVIWSLMHYGWPARLDPFARPDAFVDAFAAHCHTVAEILRSVEGPAAVYQPINEISFLSWAASSTGLVWPNQPSNPERGMQLKRVLVKAALRGMDALWAVDPMARMLHTDPLVRIVPALGAGPAQCEAAQATHDHQYQAWDMLGGKSAPELGGAARYLDVIGLNYYHDNQWEHPSGNRLHWHLSDPRRQPLSSLVKEVWHRYHRPLCIAETGHVGEGRAEWMDHIGAELLACQAQAIPIAAVCLYPLVDRPDWQQALHWHRSGLWDVPGADEGDFSRVLCTPYAERLAHWQRLINKPLHSSLPTSDRPSTMNTLVVFSHLRWDFVYQRPQQLLTRLAAKHPVLFVEEPMLDAQAPWAEIYSPCSGVQVLRMHLPGTAPGFADEHMQAMRALLTQHLAAARVQDYVLWFYTPMALPLARGLTPRGAIYDCMDELSAFDFAPPELLERERQLFKTVDMVFTGGRSLYEAKRSKHSDVHCFPSSVDHAHFGQRSVPDHPDQMALPHPRLGYFGVIDERLDLQLLAALADSHPQWQVVMVGPVVKVDPDNLPQRPNLHWLGKRRYDELPALLAGWDVALMPFALNASTRFISPTKTLEYLAAGKPVVSTAIKDVQQQYAQVVPIAHSHKDFISACEAILHRTPKDQLRFQAMAASTVSATSWDRTATAMLALLERFDLPYAQPTMPRTVGQPTTAAAVAAAV